MQEEEIVKKVVKEVLSQLQAHNEDTGGVPSGERQIICNYSNRHCHVSREVLDVLFGKGYELTKMKDLLQPGEFASEEIITVTGPKGDSLPCRILGPIRPVTQVEIARSDSFVLKIKDVPVRESGNVKGSPGAVLTGPNGSCTLEEGVIIAWRHVHFTPDDARYFGVKDREMLKIRLESPERSLVFENVVARVKPNYALEMHIDVDEANAAAIGQMTPVTLIKD